MLSENMEKALNQQIADEAYASQIYLAMASWCEKSGLSGAAKFFYDHSGEEREHMLKIFHYVNGEGGTAGVTAVKQPPGEYDSLKELIETASEHEKSVTASVHKLAEDSLQQKDHRTFNFLQWYVEEQLEEEQLFATILGKFELLGTTPNAVYLIDKELGEMAGS